MRKISVKNIAVTALCVAMGVLLPMVFHAFGAGSVFLPMHIPVFICGFLCGARYGGLCALLSVILSSLITGMPPIYPIGISMIFELAAYGILSSLLYKKFGVYLSLLGAMLAGRAVSGIANTILMGLVGKSYGFAAFISAAFLNSLPGIAIQIIAIPIIIIALEKSGFISKAKTNGE